MSDLDDLIDSFVEKGHSEEDAAEMAHAVIRRRKNGKTLAKKENEHSFEETPDEARRRWIEEERNDPQGFYSGGATAGGVFGESVVAFSDFDPGAVSRSAEFMVQRQTLEVQTRLLDQLERAERRELNAAKAPPLLDEGRGAGRRLSRRKR